MHYIVANCPKNGCTVLQSVSVCLPTHTSQKPNIQTSLNLFSVHVNQSVQLGSASDDCNMLCTSSFVEDIMFSYNSNSTVMAFGCGDESV